MNSRKKQEKELTHLIKYVDLTTTIPFTILVLYLIIDTPTWMDSAIGLAGCIALIGSNLCTGFVQRDFKEASLQL